MDDDPAGQVRERDVGARGAQIGDEHVAGVRAEPEKARRAAAGRGPEPVLGQQPVVEERLDPLRHDRAAEAGRLDEFGAGRLAVRADVVEHGNEAVRGIGTVRDGPFRPCLLVGTRGHFRADCKNICRNPQDFS